MLEIQGFRGLRFDPEKTGPLDHVITPPYDVISPEQRQTLAEQCPHNMVHLILPEDQDGMSRYDVAARKLDEWVAAGALRQDAEPSFYLLRQRYADLYGASQTRCGFFGALRLPEPDERFILGHERTFDKPVEDRLRLTAATQANLGPVFSLYSDPARELDWFFRSMKERPPDAVARTIDGVRQELWRVPYNPRVTEFLQEQTLYIADGHHRFRTALTYRDQMRAANPKAGRQAYDFVLMGFVSLQDPGLKIYPAHRVVKQLAELDLDAFMRALKRYFEIAPVEGNLAIQVRRSRARCAIGVCMAGRGDFILRLRDSDRAELLGDDHGPAWRDLDVAVLHRGILERILKIPEGTQFIYETDAAKAMAMPHEGQAAMSFILRATRPDQICACAEAGEAMPQKSTYFFPKLPSGAVIYCLAP